MYSEAVIKASVNDIVKQIVSTMTLTLSEEFIREQLKQNYNRGLESAEKEFNLDFIRDDSVLDLLQDYTFDNVKDMNEEIASDLRGVLMRGILAGDSTQDLTGSVSEVIDASKSRVQAIARTETNRAFNTARLDAGKQLPGIKKKWLLVKEDERTSGICGAMHDKYGSAEDAIDMDDQFEVSVGGKSISAQNPPFHVNCRTRLMLTIEKRTVDDE